MAEEALVDAREAWDIASDTVSSSTSETAELEGTCIDLRGVSSTTVKRRRAPGQERPR